MAFNIINKNYFSAFFFFFRTCIEKVLKRENRIDKKKAIEEPVVRFLSPRIVDLLPPP